MSTNKQKSKNKQQLKINSCQSIIKNSHQRNTIINKPNNTIIIMKKSNSNIITNNYQLIITKNNPSIITYTNLRKSTIITINLLQN
jgi:mannose-1-phosphate guanylyltransferase